jgi:hypothetical protein
LLSPPWAKLAAGNFQNFGTFWQRLAAIVHHLPIVRKVKLASAAQDEKRASIDRGNWTRIKAREMKAAFGHRHSLLRRVSCRVPACAWFFASVVNAAICPSGKSLRFIRSDSQALPRKIFQFRFSEIYVLLAPIPARQEGASADRHETWDGMRWTHMARSTKRVVADGVKAVSRRRRWRVAPALRPADRRANSTQLLFCSRADDDASLGR